MGEKAVKITSCLQRTAFEAAATRIMGLIPVKKRLARMLFAGTLMPGMSNIVEGFSLMDKMLFAIVNGVF
jgi:hypothetical protein